MLVESDLLDSASVLLQLPFVTNLTSDQHLDLLAAVDDALLRGCRSRGGFLVGDPLRDSICFDLDQLLGGKLLDEIDQLLTVRLLQDRELCAIALADLLESLASDQLLGLLQQSKPDAGHQGLGFPSLLDLDTGKLLDALCLLNLIGAPASIAKPL